jgi:hypothetical protein
MLSTVPPTEQLASIIPEPDVIRQRLERCQAEADLLRRLLRLSLQRDEKTRTLAIQRGGQHAATA